MCNLKKAIGVLLMGASLTFLPVAHAEIMTYEGTGEYIMSDFETPDIAKQRAKARAEQHAVEQAGVYVKSYTRTVNNTLVEDEITAIANMVIKIVDVQYITNPVSEAGGSFQIVAKIRATVDSSRIDGWLKREQQENRELVEQNKQLQADKAKLDAELTALRKKLANVTNAQEKQILEKAAASVDRKFLANQKIKEGWRLDSEGKYVEAAAVFSQAIGFDENNSRAYYSRGTAYGKQGNYTQAIADFTQAIAINPKFAEAYNNRGNIYDDKGNYTQAIADYTQAIALNPKLVEAYNNRGFAYTRQGNYTQAIADFIKAISLNPNLDGVYHNRGICYATQGKYTQAIADFTKAITLSPNNAKTYQARGIVYKYIGKIQQANADFAKAKELSGK
ncbi:tetratricopeptide repeat protein [Selenomonas ruminantium]|uniref:TPR repeat-containing protein n=1 Tax=Selenomonas ruminantium TaxID=971 RepID=A0A1H3WDS6_SELRU|nr:tetratricopeptide repeat protein [Selenomonas ruminantium]SDZ84398.1 TPR repeat-containing protein [Selenomonas ruminantium]